MPVGTGYRESSYGTRFPSLVDTTTLWDPHREPINEYDALMRCDFGEEPADIPDGMFLAEMESVLTPKEWAAINFRIIGGMSLELAGKYLGAEFPRKGVPMPFSKQAVSNIVNGGLKKLRNHLERKDNDEVEESVYAGDVGTGSMG